MKLSLIPTCFLFTLIVALGSTHEAHATDYSLLFDPQPTEGYLPQFSRTVAPAQRTKIALELNYPEELIFDEWPVTFGVPLPRGALLSAGHARVVTEGGRVVDAEIEASATWFGPDGPVKWLLVEMNVRRGESYWLEFGTDVQVRAPVEKGLQASMSDDAITIDTGPMQLYLDRRTAALPGRITVQGVVITEGDMPMSLMDQDGREYFASHRAEDFSVELESAHSQKAVIRAEGWYLDEEHKPLCKYIVRLEVYAGQPVVRVLHTLIVGFDTDKVQLRDIAFPLPLTERVSSDQVEYGIVSEGELEWISASVPAALTQLTARSFVVQELSKTNGWEELKGEMVADGYRAAGLMQVGSVSGGVSIGVRNFWQDYAKELEARSDSVVVHFWPRHAGNVLDLSARGQLGSRYDEWDRVYHLDYYRGGLDQFDQAYGLAKTNEVLLSFYATAEGMQQSASHAASILKPPLVIVDPQWMVASDVFGPLAPAGLDEFRDIEAAYRAAYEHFLLLQDQIWHRPDHIGNYGFFDFGDVNYSVFFNASENRWEPRPWRRAASRFYGVVRMPWLMYARTGDRSFLEFGENNARHVMDIDMAHLDNADIDPRFPKLAGGRYGGNGGIIHYGANMYQIGPDSHVDQWLFYYYMTGYRRALDVLAMEGEYYLDQFPNNGRLHRYAHRGSGGALSAMVTLWEATWDERYLSAAQQIAETMYGAAEDDEDGTVRSDDVYMNPGMIAYYQATGDERMRDLILSNMEQRRDLRLADGDPRAFTALGPAAAYYFTGDPEFLRRPLFLLQQYVRDMITEGDPLMIGIPDGRWAMAHNTVHMQYGPYLQEALRHLDAPISPAANYAGTDSEIWIDNPTGDPFSVGVYWSVLARPFHWGPVVREWPAYAHHNQPQNEIQLIDPSGEIVASQRIDFAASVSLPYNTQEYPFSGQVHLSAPAGDAGTYRVRMKEEPKFPVRLAVIDSAEHNVVFPIEGAKLSHAESYYFSAPEQSEFAVEFQLGSLGKDYRVQLIDAEGKVVREVELERRGMPMKEPLRWVLSAHEGNRSELWQFKVRPYLPELSDVVLRFEGAPSFVSTEPGQYFIPSKGTNITDISVMAAPPEGVKDIVVLDGTGPAKRMLDSAPSSRQGRLSFWIQPLWSDVDYTDQTLVRLGDLIIYRRLQSGTYARIGGEARLQSGFILRPGHWYHVELAWDLDQPSVTLSIDGVVMARDRKDSLKKIEEWSDDKLILGGNTPMRISIDTVE